MSAMDLTADEHYARGLELLEVAERQPNTNSAVNYAAIATAHFAAAQAIATKRAAENEAGGLHDIGSLRWSV